ncbi:hypothetical protein [Prevotella falsenii]|uniref:hypothetical protein n=1 Tax=Prevotella falsenii TaxID=515414 RepID=UPI00046A710B|nr:hypothetical protein [Prevotella falsenii]
MGKTIKAIRLYLRDKVNTKDLKIWISKSLPADGSKADYVQNVDISSLNAGDEGEEKTGLANDIALTTPYTVGAEGVYVGYSLTITNALAVTKFPLVISDGNMQANSLFVRTSVSVTDWTDATGDFGPLYVWLLVENTDPAGIGGISENTGELQEVARYTVDGRRISTPQRGLNIVKMSDGSTAKVLVK